MFRSLPHPLRLWEVVSVIQDLPYTRQLEIIDKLEVKSEIRHLNVLRSYFLMSDEDMIYNYNRSSDAGITPAKHNELTRLTIIYILTLTTLNVRIFEKDREDKYAVENEFTQYFATLSFEMKTSVYQSLPPELSLTWIGRDYFRELATRAVDEGIESVRKLRKQLAIQTIDVARNWRKFHRETLVIDVFIFEQAVIADKVDIVNELLYVSPTRREFANYVGYTLKHASKDYLEEVLKVCRGDRTRLLAIIPQYWEPNDTDDRTRTRVHMLLAIDPKANEADFFHILREDPKLFAIFILETLDYFDWMKHLDLHIVNNIFNSQV